MRHETNVSLRCLAITTLPQLCALFPPGCNRTIRTSVGWIRWTGRMGRCIVRIRAPLKDPQVIEVKVRRLQVGFLKEARCEGAYFQFSDNADDPDDETTGRYCGHVTGNATRLFLRRGPDLTITLSSDKQFASTNPVIFSAQFSILPIRLAVERHRGYSASTSPTCPVECNVRNEHRSCRLTSPGYPSVYPRGIRCRIALESNAGRFRIGGQPEDLFDLMNYTDQESCQMENCEDSFDSREKGSSVAKGQNRIEADESIIGDDWSRNEYSSWIPAMKHTTETNGQLARLRHYKKKAIQQYWGEQHRHKELPLKSDTSEPKLRIKSMRSKITRKNHRGVVPNHYFNNDSERPSETISRAMVCIARIFVSLNRYVSVNDSFLLWSYCDASHWDINNIQIPLTSSGNELLIQYYSAKGSHDGQGFTYAISYRFIRKERNSTVAKRKYKSISLRPVNLSALNLNNTDSDDCDSRIGTFKNWFAVLVVFGIVSFIGAVITIVVLTIKCLRIGSTENKLLQNGKR
ncbi:hypothetical protein ALC62_11447 [Cyphomyrmex costatus]|uniref:CUB domain-containing protein n=1 Tax=Cyphomyrmex costatus TaxID=456900 RepID=A0A195CD07_9HYME|nr:hypothetical protein ALC62_11447 [Cyphomyrmex costatus]